MPRLTDEERLEFYCLLDEALEKLDSPKNSKKVHWSKMSISVLQKLLKVECAELDVAVNHLGVDDINTECDDIINFAMFIKHNIKKRGC